MRKSLTWLLCLALLTAAVPALADAFTSEGDTWQVGFGKRTIEPDFSNGEPLYIAGYNSGWEISGVLDLCEARAVWLDTGSKGVMIIGIDCVALTSGTVAAIRAALADLTDCAAINVYATHTHAGIDTLGLWGPTAIDGKNDAYMTALQAAAVSAARDAYAARTPGTLHYGSVLTENMYRDSRDPQVYDANLYQLRFAPADGSAGLRMYFYGAHAEALRGSNRLLSRDFPGVLCDLIAGRTGDHAMYLPGAVGGLIMTREFLYTNVNAEGNMRMTGEKLADYAMTITPEKEQAVSPALQAANVRFTVPLDNVGFMYFRFLGLLDNKAVPYASSATGYGVETELAAVRLGDVTLAMLPGEIFPELVTGEAYGQNNPHGVNPKPLADIAAAHSDGPLLIVGLTNDEVGYIVPPSDFLVHPDAPYLKRITDAHGEDHYEETNSAGPACAQCIADAFEAALGQLDTP